MRASVVVDYSFCTPITFAALPPLSMFRIYWPVLYLIFAVSFGAQAQRVLLKPANYPRDLLRDSVYQFAQSVYQQADCVFSVVRFYDNGYYAENASIGTVIWQKSGQRHARVFKAGAPSTVLTPRLPLDTLFAFYSHQHISKLSTVVPAPEDGPMQGPAYSVDVFMANAWGSHTEGFNVRAPARHSRVPGKEPATFVPDPRCAWLDLWEQVML